MKITREESNLHDQACEILKKPGDLSYEDQLFVLRNWTPMAEHNVGKGGIFFTPPNIAGELSVYANPGDRVKVLDIGAGIGTLTWATQRMSYFNPTTKFVCIEINPDFVEVGKKLVPVCDWHCGDVFDQEFMAHIFNKYEGFHITISNPPYGNLPTADTSWLKTKGPAQFKFVEIAVRMAQQGGLFIMPEINADYDQVNQCYRDPKPSDKYFKKNFPGVNLFVIPTDLEPDEGESWKGADPNVAIVDINVDDCEFTLPYGVGFAKQQALL